MSNLKILSWNMQHKTSHWHYVLSSGADIALLQEAKSPCPEDAEKLSMDLDANHPATQLPWRVAVVGLNKNIKFTPIQTQPIGGNNPDALMVSRIGTIAPAAIEIPDTGEKIIVVSLYSYWANPLSITGSKWIYADASAHRLISDLSALIGNQSKHKIIAAGDLNLLFGYGESNSLYWKKRYDTVFDRMSALGFRFMGPQAPDGGQQASPWPEELPTDSRNVPTFRTKKHNPETATRQLDYVFASNSLADRLSVKAENSIDEWGPSDHCRLMIELES